MKNWNLQVSDNKRKPQYHCDASIECVLNMLNHIRVREHVAYYIFCIVSSLRMFFTRWAVWCCVELSCIEKRNHQLLQHKIQHEILVSRLYNFRPSKCHSEWYADLKIHLCWSTYDTSMPSTYFVCNMIVHERIWNYFECPFCSMSKDFGCHIQTESEFVCKQNLTPTMLPPSKLKLSCPPSLSCIVAWSQQNSNYWITCIETTLRKSISECLTAPFVLWPITAMFATKYHYPFRLEKLLIEYIGRKFLW